GSEPVEIIEARASCGCLTPRLAKRSYDPGEKGDVLFEVNTLIPAPGTHTWRVQLDYRSGETNYQIPLQLTANLIRDVAVEPAALTVYTDRAMSHEVILTDLREKPLSVSEVHTSSGPLKAAVAADSRDGDGHQSYKI